jgi:hypothetical protein
LRSWTPPLGEVIFYKKTRTKVDALPDVYAAWGVNKWQKTDREGCMAGGLGWLFFHATVFTKICKTQADSMKFSSVCFFDKVLIINGVLSNFSIIKTCPDCSGLSHLLKSSLITTKKNPHDAVFATWGFFLFKKTNCTR